MTDDRSESDARSDAALAVWAVTADALARGEQIFLLLPDGPAALSELEHEAFWIRPVWGGGDPRHLTEPYQDRLRALEDLRHDDGRVRLKYHATAEYLDALTVPGELRPLDGEHTLNYRAVQSLFERSREGPVGLLVLRVYERREAVLVPAEEVPPPGGSPAPDPGERTRPSEDDPEVEHPRWVTLPEPLPLGEMEPVLPGDRFVSEKARLLQRTGTIRAV